MGCKRIRHQKTADSVHGILSNKTPICASWVNGLMTALCSNEPGSMHAPVILSLCSGLIVGGLAQRTNLWPVVSKISFSLTNLILNLTIGDYFTPGFFPQPVAHKDRENCCDYRIGCIAYPVS
ncbi:hypothetical protein [Lacrimispora amygdalina]|uniref:hypothetical protein n=1 Tax=Lacrimispora amygdalina TaxID=253257 RepID=UPI001478B0C8|nr:hypothetical protein [Clostridium indicum]